MTSSAPNVLLVAARTEAHVQFLASIEPHSAVFHGVSKDQVEEYEMEKLSDLTVASDDAPPPIHIVFMLMCTKLLH